MRAALTALVIFGGVGLAAWYAARTDAAAASGNETFKEVVDMVDKAINQATGLNLLDWQKVAARPENHIYVRLLAAAENKHGIPSGMLTRLAYQESRFRHDIITGATVSSAGAQGIMQIVPRWHPGVDPLVPADAIDYAGKYLASLHRSFGTWELALQAYNWGPGNLRKYLNRELASIPLETRNYSGQILADLGNTGAFA